MKKFPPVAGCVCGVLGAAGLICNIFWALPDAVYLLIALCLLVNAATLIYNFRQVNRKKRD